MKIPAIEIQKFLDTLSQDWYIEEEILEPYYDKEGILTSSDVINVLDGDIEILYQGENTSYPGPEKDFMKEFKKWKKTQNTATLIIEVPLDKKDKLVEQIKLFGGKVV
jgi:hypothetical protein